MSDLLKMQNQINKQTDHNLDFASTTPKSKDPYIYTQFRENTSGSG